MKLVESNIPVGYTVKVKYRFSPVGRILSTTAWIRNKDGKLVGVGHTKVNKKEKGPTRKLGRMIAIGRAMKDMVDNEKEVKYNADYSYDGMWYKNYDNVFGIGVNL